MAIPTMAQQQHKLSFVWRFLVAVLIVTTQPSSSSSSRLLLVQAEDTPSSSSSSSSTAAKYTTNTQVSWAITRPDELAFEYHQQLYDDFMEGCNEASNFACQSGEEFRLKMNRLQPGGVVNFTETGFTKLRAPQKLMDLINTFWQTNKNKTKIEWKQVNSYHNMWSNPVYFVSLEDANLGGGPDLQRAVWREAQPVLEAWTGQALIPVSMYGVREYRNHSILAPHVDRFPLVTSCIINVDQDVDEDWPLEVFDHDGNAHNVTMVPGDMVLYESHSVIHGRPFPLKGRSFVNVFLHFQPIGPLEDIEQWGPGVRNLPPYVVPGGQWEAEYRKTGRERWDMPESVPASLARGDIRALEYIFLHNPDALHRRDYNGWLPVHEATYRGDLQGLKFLLDHGATVDDRIGKAGQDVGTGPDVLGIANLSELVDDEHPVMLFLLNEMAESEL